MNISILDCTLRDGGYVNNWEFGEKTIRKISSRLSQSGVDIVEYGFFSKTKASSKGQSIFSSISEVENYHTVNSSVKYALMINCGECNDDDIPEYNGGYVKIIRIAFHKQQQKEAQKLCLALIEKGYEIFLQPMVTMSYSETELLQLIEWANQHKPDAFYIVDSFGTMRQNDVIKVFNILDNALDQKIKIGFHSHNNLQLSFSNAQELIKMNSSRDIIIDSSVFGMGRGAGNLCTELLTQYINENIRNKYDLIPILEIMDECIMPIYSQHPWGYSAAYYLAAANNCHPNYATYLVNKQTITICDINVIIKSIPINKKQIYDKHLIENLYLEHLQRNVDDTTTIRKITELCDGRMVLIIAPGKSLSENYQQIENFIKLNREHLVIFSVNHVPKKLIYDKIFIGNMKRFNNIDITSAEIASKVICTSNISTSNSMDIVNYASYLNNEDCISDNSGLMLINILRKSGVKKFALAGFDGFKLSNNYYDDKLTLGVAYEKHLAQNKAISEYFRNMKNSCDVEFLTKTVYTEEIL